MNLRTSLALAHFKVKHNAESVPFHILEAAAANLAAAAKKDISPRSTSAVDARNSNGTQVSSHLVIVGALFID